MSGRFWITGLPRSRTAWFSVAATTSSSICVHEPTSRLQSFGDLCEFWKPKFGVDFGVSDSALAMRAEIILQQLQPRTLIIDRPVDECVASYLEYAERNGLPSDGEACLHFANEALSALETIRENPLVCSVDYDDLADYAILYRAMEWILPGRDFPDLKALMGLNIQVHNPRSFIGAAMTHSRWHMNRRA